jgi:hypothetical protein
VSHLGNDIRSLRAKREDADFDLTTQFEKLDAEDAIILADSILTDLAGLSGTVIQNVVSNFISTL